MKEKLQGIRDKALASIEQAKDASMINDIKVAILGKKVSLHRC